MHIVKLNLARNCIRYLIRLYGIKEIFIPYYTCPTVWQAAQKEKCKIKFYHIDNNFMPLQNFEKKDFIIYTNYFGINNKNCETLADQYPNLIIDNSQAFFAPHYGLASFNSLRKFFNVQNGAYLYCENFLNENFEKDNLNIIPVSAQENYQLFCENETLLNQQEIKTISPIVENEMKNIDFEQEKQLRQEIFNKYLTKFEAQNKLHIIPQKDEIPYCYPFSPTNNNVKNNLLTKHISIIRLWKDLPETYPEYELYNDIAALPLNRYSEDIIK